MRAACCATPRDPSPNPNPNPRPANALIVGLGAISAYAFSLTARMCVANDAESLGEAWKKAIGERTAWIVPAALAALTVRPARPEPVPEPTPKPMPKPMPKPNPMPHAEPRPKPKPKPRPKPIQNPVP